MPGNFDPVDQVTRALEAFGFTVTEEQEDDGSGYVVLNAHSGSNVARVSVDVEDAYDGPLNSNGGDGVFAANH